MCPGKVLEICTNAEKNKIFSFATGLTIKTVSGSGSYLVDITQSFARTKLTIYGVYFNTVKIYHIAVNCFTWSPCKNSTYQ